MPPYSDNRQALWLQAPWLQLFSLWMGVLCLDGVLCRDGVLCPDGVLCWDGVLRRENPVGWASCWAGRGHAEGELASAARRVASWLHHFVFVWVLDFLSPSRNLNGV